MPTCIVINQMQFVCIPELFLTRNLYVGMLLSLNVVKFWNTLLSTTALPEEQFHKEYPWT